MCSSCVESLRGVVLLTVVLPAPIRRGRKRATLGDDSDDDDDGDGDGDAAAGSAGAKPAGDEDVEPAAKKARAS